MKDKRLLNIFTVVFLDLLGFGLILPLLPFYAATYGASPTLVGLLVASYAAAQLIGAPLLGRLSDRAGRRPVLLLSIAGTALSLLLLGLADPLGRLLASGAPGQADTLILLLLFTARILDGLTGGNISVAQAYITDITDAPNRARGLGLIGAAFGLGFILGPAAGGLLSRWGYAVPALAAAGLSAANLLSVYLTLPESLTSTRRRELASRPGLSLAALGAAFRHPHVGTLLNTRFVFGLAFATFQTIFPLYAQYRLALSPQSTGFILTYVGLLAVLVQGVAIGWLTARVREERLILAAAALMALSLLAWAFTPSVLLLLAVLAPLALAGGTMNTLLHSALTRAVEPNEVGGILGISTSVESATRALAPSLGGLLLGQLGTAAPGLFGALLTALLVPYIWQKLLPGIRPRPNPPIEPAAQDQAGVL